MAGRQPASLLQYCMQPSKVILMSLNMHRRGATDEHFDGTLVHVPFRHCSRYRGKSSTVFRPRYLALNVPLLSFLDLL